MLKRIVVILLCVVLVLPWSSAFAVNEEETPSGLAFSDLESFIDDYMDQYIGKTSPGAAVVLVHEDKIIFSKGYGYANIETKTLVDSTDTVFEYGSVSKLFVYTTIMRLSEQGKIDLHADIRQYLPEGFLKKLQYDEPITMLNIMNHTTGFEDYLFDVILPSPDNLPSLEQVLQQSQPKQVYKPGTVSAYSNYAVSLAAYIAQQITGQDFDQYLLDTVFEPLNMNQTSAHITLKDRPALLNTKATGYYAQGDGNFKTGQWSYVVLYPAGSVTGTADDLARFAMALMPDAGQDSPLFAKRATLDEMLTQTHPMGPGLTGFAHGFIEWDGEYRAIGHGGNTIAFSSQINIVPERRFGVIVLTNAAGEMDISSGLTEALIGKRDKATPVGGDNLPDAKVVEGTYISARRMHTGFLEVYGYLMLLNVKALEPNKIELSTGGQTSTLVQTRPYVFQRVEADGKIFEYHFDTVYFDVSNGEVQRMSGDFLPLSRGRTKPWLIASLLVVAFATIYFILAPIALLIGRLWRRKKDPSSRASGLQRAHTVLVLSGTALLINNALVVARMLSNNYRSFSELRPHILLNYPLVALAAVFCILLAVKWAGSKHAKGQKLISAITMIAILALITTLINWQFLNLWV